MSKPQVVIMRKDKKIRHKFLHLAAFAVTGGMSGIITAAEAANHAAYNARTRQLQEAAEAEDVDLSRGPSTEELLASSARTLGDLRGKYRGRAADAMRAEFRAEHVPGSSEYKARHSAPPES